MIQDIKKLFKHSATYGVGIILGKIAGFIMLPIYTRYLTPSDYGILQLLMLTTDIIGMVIGAGINHAIIRFYYQYENIKDKNEVISTSFILTILSFSLTFLCLFPFSSILALVIFDDVSYTFYFRLVLVNFLLSSGYEIPLIFIKAQQKSGKFVIINFIRLILQLSLNIYFVMFLKTGVVGILYSSIISSILTSTYVTYDTFKQVQIHFSMRKTKEMVKYGTPLIFSNVGAFILTFSDRYFLKYYATLSDVGIYSLGYKFGMLLSVLLIGPFNQIWSAQLFEIAKKEDAQETFKKVFTYFAIGVITFGLFISIFSKDAIKIMANSAFWKAYEVVPVIVLSYVVYGFFLQFMVGIFVQKKTHYLSIITIIAAISNIIFNLLLIPKYSTMGAAWATVLAFIIRFLGLYFISEKIMPIDYEWTKILKLSAIAIFFYIITCYINYDDIIKSLSLNIIVFLTFLSFIYKLDILTTQEKTKVINFLKNPIAGIKQIKLA